MTPLTREQIAELRATRKFPVTLIWEEFQALLDTAKAFWRARELLETLTAFVDENGHLLIRSGAVIDAITLSGLVADSQKFLSETAAQGRGVA